MFRRIVLAAVLILGGAFLLAFVEDRHEAIVAASSSRGAPSEQRVTVVETNLTIPANTTVVSDPVDLDGFARWSFQVTFRQGSPFDVDWRPVYRVRNDLGYTPWFRSPYSSDLISSHLVPAPSAAIEIRNQSPFEVRIAISSVAYRQSRELGNASGDHNRVYAVASSVAQVDPQIVQVAPGGTVSSSPFSLGAANAVYFQLLGDPGSNITVDLEWKVFNQQPFVAKDSSIGIGMGQTGVGMVGPFDAEAPFARLRFTNGSAESFEVRPGAYILTTD